MSAHAYLTVKEQSYAEIREKASRFFTVVCPVTTDEEANAVLASLWKAHPKATHICYAFKLGLGQDSYRINDDGEPSGTAGRPIYGQILSSGLTDVAIFVIRYYGGTKLGTSGLISAYKEAAKAGIDQATIVEKHIKEIYLLQFDYQHMGKVLNELKNLHFDIITKEFNEDPAVEIAINKGDGPQNLAVLKAKLLEISLDRIDDATEVPFCKIDLINEIKR